MHFTLALSECRRIWPLYPVCVFGELHNLIYLLCTYWNFGKGEDMKYIYIYIYKIKDNNINWAKFGDCKA